MTDTFRELLDTELKPRTAGAMPSSRTEDQTTQALASDSIDEVKAQLAHVWAHYQSLEFALSAAGEHVKVITEELAEIETLNGLTPDSTEDLLELVARYYTGPVVELAYEAAHQTLPLVTFLGKSVPDALRMIYPQLDHTDPAREAAVDEAIEAILDTEGTN